MSALMCVNSIECAVLQFQDYIHRVGRTARAGRAGRAVTFVTQYDVELYQRIEELLGTKLEQYPCDEAQVGSIKYTLALLCWLVICPC